MAGISRRSVVGGGLVAAVATVTGAGLAEAAQPSGYTIEEPNLTGLRTKGSALVAHARIFHGGTEVGLLRASSIVSDAGGTGHHSGDLSTQVIELPHATLVGVGIALAHSLEGTYAITGGTGSWAGARGSYRIEGQALHITLIH